MADDFLTRSINDLAETTTVSPTAMTIVQELNGDTKKLRIERLLGKLIATDTAKSSQADLFADLAHPAETVALVFDDPVPLNNGWYRKGGDTGAGAWAQFETLSIAARAAAEAAALRAEAVVGTLGGALVPLAEASLPTADPNLIELDFPAATVLAVGGQVRWQVPTTTTAPIVIRDPIYGDTLLYLPEGGRAGGGQGTLLEREVITMRRLPPGSNGWEITASSFDNIRGRLRASEWGNHLPASTPSHLRVETESKRQVLSAGYSLTLLSQAGGIEPGAVITVNGQGPYALRKSENAPIGRDDVRRITPAHFVFSGDPSNSFYLSGATMPGVNLTVLDRRTATQTAASRSALLDEAYGGFQLSEGQRTMAPTEFVVVIVGSSLGNHAGTGDATKGIEHKTRTLLQGLMGPQYEVIVDNQSVGGSGLLNGGNSGRTFRAQLANAARPIVHLVVNIGGMNDGTVQGIAVLGLDLLQAAQDTLMDDVAELGAIYLGLTTPFPHSVRTPIEIPVGNNLRKPFATFSVPLPYVVDPVARTIFFDANWARDVTNGWGSIVLRPSDRLQFLSGPNAGAGALTIAAIAADGRTITVAAGPALVAQSGATTELRHVEIDPEAVLTPPASAWKPVRDWLGIGDPAQAFAGSFGHDLYNRMLRDAVARRGGVLADWWQSFTAASRAVGEDTLFPFNEFNHPNGDGYDTMDVPLYAALREVVEMALPRQYRAAP